MGRKNLRLGDVVTVKIDRISGNGNIIAELPPIYKGNHIHVCNGAVGELASVEIIDDGSPPQGKMKRIIDKPKHKYHDMSIKNQIRSLNEENDSTGEITDPRLSNLKEISNSSNKTTVHELVQEMRAEELRKNKKNKDDKTGIKHDIANKKL